MRRSIYGALIALGLAALPVPVHAANNTNLQLSILDEECYVDLVINGGTPYIFVQPEDCEIPPEPPGPEPEPQPGPDPQPVPRGTTPVPRGTFNPQFPGFGTGPLVPLPGPGDGDDDGEQPAPVRPEEPLPDDGALPEVAAVLTIACAVIVTTIAAALLLLPGSRKYLLQLLRTLFRR